VVLTAALPVLPAYVLAGGVVYLASARSEAQLGAPTKGEEVVHQQRELGERVARGDRPSDSAADTRRDVLRGDAEPSWVAPAVTGHD